MGAEGEPVSNIDHPAHYNRHPSGVEAIDVCESLPFNLSNAVKYLMRADHKGQRTDDLRKAAWYLRREAQRANATRAYRDEQRTLVRLDDATRGLWWAIRRTEERPGGTLTVLGHLACYCTVPDGARFFASGLLDLAARLESEASAMEVSP